MGIGGQVQIQVQAQAQVQVQVQVQVNPTLCRKCMQPLRLAGEVVTFQEPTCGKRQVAIPDPLGNPETSADPGPEWERRWAWSAAHN